MTRDKILSNPVNQHYDTMMYHPVYLDFYEGTDFANHGYWDDQTRSAAQACTDLMEKLLAMVPAKQGRILDVACGKGTTTRHLLKYFPANQVTGINISEKQLDTARAKSPEIDFQLMDATQLKFADNTFDAIICVEAAFHFDTRRQFLAEALRVLKVGGRLVLSDILATREAERNRALRNESNYLASPAEYRELLREVGFGEIDVVDVTEPCWVNFFVHLTGLYHRQLVKREITFERLQEILANTYSRVNEVTYYLLAGATKVR